MTPCEKKGYEVGQVFEVTSRPAGINPYAKLGDRLVLIRDDGTTSPEFYSLDRKNCYDEHNFYVKLTGVTRIYPPEEKPSKVTITCEGREVEISRESAIALNLIDD